MSRDPLSHEVIVGSLKAAAWERAKGELRSIVALEGSLHGASMENGLFRFQVIEEQINDFIKSFEEQEFNL